MTHSPKGSCGKNQVTSEIFKESNAKALHITNLSWRRKIRKIHITGITKISRTSLLILHVVFQQQRTNDRQLVNADLSSYLPPSTVHMGLHPDELMTKMAIQQLEGSDGISGRIVVLKCKCGSISVFATLIN